MEDLGQQLQKILSDPQSMQQIQGILGSLGNSAPAPAAPGPDLSGLGAAQQEAPLATLTPQALGMVAKLAPLLGRGNQEDDATRLLRALRPLLGEARQKKVDEALRILQMMRLLPLSKESGLFSGLLGSLL